MVPVRIGIDIRYISDHFPGIGRYTMNLVVALQQLAQTHELVLVGNTRLPNSRHDLSRLMQSPACTFIDTPIRPFSLAEQTRLPILIRSLKLNVWHTPYYVRAYRQLSCPSVVTIHDLIGRRFPRALPPRGRMIYQVMMRLAIRSSQHIITVSQHACSDLIAYYRLPAEKITVTLEAADPHFTPQPAAAIAALREQYGLPESYVLYLGANKPHKNLGRLIRAWEQLRAPHLVLAGHEDPRYPEARQLVASYGLEASVTFCPM